MISFQRARRLCLIKDDPYRSGNGREGFSRILLRRGGNSIRKHDESMVPLSKWDFCVSPATIFRRVSFLLSRLSRLPIEWNDCCLLWRYLDHWENFYERIIIVGSYLFEQDYLLEQFAVPLKLDKLYYWWDKSRGVSYFFNCSFTVIGYHWNWYIRLKANILVPKLVILQI